MCGSLDREWSRWVRISEIRKMTHEDGQRFMARTSPLRYSSVLIITSPRVIGSPRFHHPCYECGVVHLRERKGMTAEKSFASLEISHTVACKINGAIQKNVSFFQPCVTALNLTEFRRTTNQNAEENNRYATPVAFSENELSI